MYKFRFLSFLLALIFLSASCVSSKKYQELKLVKETYRQEAEQYGAVDATNVALRAEVNENKHFLRENMRELEEVTLDVDRLRGENQDLINRYNKLLDQNSNIVTSTSSKMTILEQELGEKERELNMKSRELDLIQSELGQRENNLIGLRQELVQREKRINELQEAIDTQNALMNALRSNINDAIRGFSASDLSVEERSGKLYVTLSQNLLFKPGSDNIDAKGQEALRNLAVVLAANADINILVEGHTDSDGTADFNWKLSSDRAIAVTKILISGGVIPERMTAAGRAFYMPIAPNDSSANKAKNRRTEIILSPRLDVLYDIVK